MRFVFCVIIAVVLLPQCSFSAQARPSLAYTFQRDHDLVVTVVVRYNSGKPEGEVGVMQFSSGAQKITPFRMTHDRFEKIWSSFVSSGIEQHPIEQVRRTIDLDFYYVFLIGGRKYAVLKGKASPALVALAERMQACATPNTLALPGARKRAPSSDTERVIIH